MAALTTLPLASQASPRDDAAPGRGGSKTLVAYFSRTGNTRVIAGLIQRARGADVFEMQAAEPYPADYLATVEAARQECDSGRARALAAQVANMAAYATVYLGFPIWGETVPPVVRAFLAAHDLAGKAVVPFTTHGGYGLGDSAAVLARSAPTARLHAAFVMEADQERRTMNQVNGWLETVKA